MNSLSADAMLVIFWLVAPGLLLIRFYRPRILPRVVLLLSAAALGGSVFYVRELFHHAAMAAWTRRLGFPELPASAYGEGMVTLQGPSMADFILGAALELVYLLLWLVPYGVVWILRDRRRRSPHAPTG
jgi:hypothetical protein